MYKKIARMRFLIRTYHSSKSGLSGQSAKDMLSEIESLEKETGCVMADSPLNPHAQALAGGSGKITHPEWPMPVYAHGNYADAASFFGSKRCLLLPLVEGIPLKLEYDEGELLRVSTYTGLTGNIIDRTIGGICGIPVKIPYKKRLVVTGTVYAKYAGYYSMCAMITKYRKNGICDICDMAPGLIEHFREQHELYFDPFMVLEGLDETASLRCSRSKQLDGLKRYGFGHIIKTLFNQTANAESIKNMAGKLIASVKSEGIPVQGTAFLLDDSDDARICRIDAITVTA